MVRKALQSQRGQSLEAALAGLGASIVSTARQDEESLQKLGDGGAEHSLGLATYARVAQQRGPPKAAGRATFNKVHRSNGAQDWCMPGTWLPPETRPPPAFFLLLLLDTGN